MKNMLLEKKGIGMVVTITLLMLVTVLSVTVFKLWYVGYETNLISEIEGIKINEIVVVKLLPNTLFIRSKIMDNITIKELRIEGMVCGNNIILLANQITEIDLNHCLEESYLGMKSVILVSNHSVLEFNVMLDYIFSGNYIVKFEEGSCAEGYVRLYGLENITDSHSVISTSDNATYSLCLKNNMYLLDNVCSGNYGILFYLDDIENAHAYTQPTSSLKEVWYPICANTNNVDIEIRTKFSISKPESGSVCIASFDKIDNEYGSHMGYCNSYPLKVWLIIN